MIVAGGLVSQKPIGIVSNNPNIAQQAAQREAEKQAKVDALVSKLAAQHQNQQSAAQEKKWTVPFN